MFFISSYRKSIFNHKLLLGLALIVLASVFFGGFTHNHADDPFHTKEHKSCPVSIWAHTPFHLVSDAPFSVFVLLLTGAVYFALVNPFHSKFFLTQSPRGPPIRLS